MAKYQFDTLRESERVLRIKDTLARLVVDLFHDPASLDAHMQSTDDNYPKVKALLERHKLMDGCKCNLCFGIAELLNFRKPNPELDPLIDIARKIAEDECGDK